MEKYVIDYLGEIEMKNLNDKEIEKIDDGKIITNINNSIFIMLINGDNNNVLMKVHTFSIPEKQGILKYSDYPEEGNYYAYFLLPIKTFFGFFGINGLYIDERLMGVDLSKFHANISIDQNVTIFLKGFNNNRLSNINYVNWLFGMLYEELRSMHNYSYINFYSNNNNFNFNLNITENGKPLHWAMHTMF